MAVDKTSKEFQVGVDAGWLMAYKALKNFSESNPTASLQEALNAVDVAHKPAVTLDQIIANEGI